MSGHWTEALKFDKTINVSFTENIANVSPDRKYLFFHRNNDIYWVDAKIIEDLKPKDMTSNEKEKNAKNECSSNNRLTIFSAMKELYQQIYSNEILTKDKSL